MHVLKQRHAYRYYYRLPELLKSPFEASILKRAIEANLVEVRFHNLRDYTSDNYKSVDDTQFGGGAGMVMMIEPLLFNSQEKV